MTTERARRKRFPRGQVYRPGNLGDERVLTLEELVRQDPLPATEPMPAALERMLESDSGCGTSSPKRSPTSGCRARRWGVDRTGGCGKCGWKVVAANC